MEVVGIICNNFIVKKKRIGIYKILEICYREENININFRVESRLIIFFGTPSRKDFAHYVFFSCSATIKFYRLRFLKKGSRNNATIMIIDCLARRPVHGIAADIDYDRIKSPSP